MPSWNRNVSMRALRAFAATAQRLSIREAAEDLFLTPSAVSHQIKHLETALARSLFERLPRGLKLTQQGGELLAELAPALDELDRIIERHSQPSDQKRLTLAVHPMFASELLAPKLDQFLSNHPDWAISILSAGRMDSDIQANASIRLFSRSPGTAIADRLFDLELTPLGRIELYDSIKVVAGRVVDRFPIIVQSERADAWSAWQRSARIRLPGDCPTITMNSMSAVVRAVETGLGAALLPIALCSNTIKQGDVVPLFEQSLKTKESFYFSCNSEEMGMPFVEALREWVLQEFEAWT